ncbi:hypothetical protein N657DRAFT_365245 [Parathielavia appendiculata]|uniref:Uncharacterized protein n=1 Tax=Parathielavia appendiculata TaxID=2587402 RepID=A0AAN6U3L5_9PEZI|nr:hypothetical protein N657DRAFT_365245 [Parathielavia appendiculata]
MWLMKRSRMDNHAELPENRTQQLPIQHIANFSYPRTDFVHLYHRIPSDARDSRGPESSPPPMVEDHGSDMSADDDSQYLATGPDFWDSRHAREHEARKPDYPALIKPPPGTQSSKPAITQENPRMSDPSSWGSQSSPVIRPAAVGSFSDKEAHVPQPPPKVSYSLFPPPCPAQRRPPVRSQIPSVPRQSRLEPSPHSLDFPPTPNSRSAIADGKGNAISSFGPGSPQTATPRSAHGGSIAASSSNSIPLLLRSPGPTPPDSPGGTSSSFEAPRSSDAPRYPVRLRTSSPSQREFPLSKNATRSTPSLASHAKAHQQGHAPDAHDKPLTRADLYARPLPPLPTEPPPPLVSPPHVSVFEPDSDDEDEELDSRPGSGDSKNFARRFMHGLVHHHYHHDKKGKGLLPDHKRSVSDEGPSSSLEDRNCGSSMSGIYRTINVARHRRGGAVEAASAARCAVSMDLPRDVAGNHQDQQTAEGPERHGRFWAAKESGEMLLGKILMRKG